MVSLGRAVFFGGGPPVLFFDFPAYDPPKQPADNKSHDKADDSFVGKFERGISVEEILHGKRDGSKHAKGDRRSEHHDTEQVFVMLRIASHIANVAEDGLVIND